MIQLLFWFFIVLIIYTYFLYPILLLVLKNFYQNIDVMDSDIGTPFPKVALLITAYNEERVIKAKLENCLDLDYPQKYLEIWVASDGSCDKTDEIVQFYTEKNPNIHLLKLPRLGKSMAINNAIKYLNCEIVVFSDANTEYRKDSIMSLIKKFNNKKVGCVCGRLIYKNSSNAVSGYGECLYWRYETFLKKLESYIGCVGGANGAIYAIRRELFEPLPISTINDDFMISMYILMRGFRSVYAEDAIAYEEVAQSTSGEFKRHLRDGAGHYIAIKHLIYLLNPLLGIRSLVFWSHRIFRWLIPFVLIFLFFLNLELLNTNFIYKSLFFAQTLFYFLALLGALHPKKDGVFFVCYIPFYFCNLNLALFLGALKAFTGKQRGVWQSTERLNIN